MLNHHRFQQLTGLMAERQWDTLVLYGIPTLSPHALPTFIAMLLGIGLGLLVMRTLFGVEMRVACRNDLYFVDSSARTATKLSLEAPSR